MTSCCKVASCCNVGKERRAADSAVLREVPVTVLYLVLAVFSERCLLTSARTAH
jgi:hypothetical protein